MTRAARIRATALLLAALGLVALASGAAPRAQMPAVRRFDLGDGLPSLRVSAVCEDADGFLWVSTVDGIARFDGARFESFAAAPGLSRSIPNEVRQDRRGRLWVALNGEGVARSTDGEEFEVVPLGSDRRTNTVNALRFDDQGTLWAGTEGGLVRVRERADGTLDAELLPESVRCVRPQAACATSDGSLWFVGQDGLARVRQGGVAPEPLPEAMRRTEFLCLAPGASGRLLVGDDRALWELDVGAGAWSAVPLELAKSQAVRALLHDGAGDTWVCTTDGAIRLRGGEQTSFTTDDGLPDNSLRCAFEDSGGRLWLGTWVGGLVQLGRGDVVSWTRSAALRNPDTSTVAIASDGRAIASTANDGLFELGARGATRLGPELSPRFDRVWRRLCELPGRGWVLGTDEALWFVPGPALEPARARRVGPAEGYHGGAPILVAPGMGARTALACDARGNLVRVAVAEDGTVRCEPLLAEHDRARFESPTNDPLRFVACGASAADGTDGDLWLANRRSLARLRPGGSCEPMPVAGPAARRGLPGSDVRALAVDARGRVWVALRHDGVARCDAPGADAPEWTSVPALAGRSAFALAGDRSGGMFVGTWSGVFALGPDGELLRHLTASGGLASDVVNDLAVDARERLWISTSAGVTRLEPGARTRAAVAPPAWITRIEVDGLPVAIPRRAARRFGPLELDAGSDSLLVEFSAPWLASDEPLAFQLRLAGAGEPWSAPQTDRRVRFAGLAPGDYALLVRAVAGGPGTSGRAEAARSGGTGAPGEADEEASGDSDPGGASAAAGPPARLEFSVPPPFWRSPWFLALAVLAASGAFLAWHRVRLRQALALERVRAQIALDLHDELGADLTQVAILAELARRDGAEGGEPLRKVAALAREMRASLADIVWSVDPRRDRVADLVVKLRQVGNQLVEAGGLEFALRVESDRAIEDLPLAPDQRRALYLIVKEALHNAVKHARATRIDVLLAVRGARLAVEVRDDGRGFDPAAAHAGHGLRSLRQRAGVLGAELDIASRAGATSVGLGVRLKGPA